MPPMHGKYLRGHTASLREAACKQGAYASLRPRTTVPHGKRCPIPSATFWNFVSVKPTPGDSLRPSDLGSIPAQAMQLSDQLLISPLSHPKAISLFNLNRFRKRYLKMDEDPWTCLRESATRQGQTYACAKPTNSTPVCQNRHQSKFDFHPILLHSLCPTQALRWQP